ncbi:YncE family protein [Edaphocola aurantiacus]|uniref:YncE family protein n=1 Tax=Edaphocola aurantiacus TaxID=2601682 RepID=UPI001C946605|nr:YncE family protein [Edaphocola aurantiacus]
MKAISSLLCGVLLVGSSYAGNKEYILVLSKTEGKMVVLDYNALDSITAVSVGPDPHEVVTSADGSRAFISVPQMNAAGHEIDIVDLKTLKLLHKVDTRPFYIPHGLVYRNGILWFTAQGSKAVVQYDVQADRMINVFGTGQDFTHLLYLSTDEKQFYTTNVESGTVSIFDWQTLPPYMPPTGKLPAGATERQEWRQTLVPTGLGSEGFDVLESAQELWTARPDGHVIVVDLLQKKIKKDINTGVEGLHRLRITPDGKTVCIVSVKTGDLLYYDRATGKFLESRNIGQGAGIYMDKGRNRMFISCTPNNYVVVIDLNTRKEITRIPIGKPDGITSVQVVE